MELIQMITLIVQVQF